MVQRRFHCIYVSLRTKTEHFLQRNFELFIDHHVWGVFFLTNISSYSVKLYRLRSMGRYYAVLKQIMCLCFIFITKTLCRSERNKLIQLHVTLIWKEPDMLNATILYINAEKLFLFLYRVSYLPEKYVYL